jgi:hypothetical protein
MGQELSNLGFDPANPDGAMDMILAEARGLPAAGKGSLMSVAPGNTVIDKNTFQPVYQAPNKPGADTKFSEGATKAANFANMMEQSEGALETLAPKDAQGKLLPLESPVGFVGSVREGVLPEGAANTMRGGPYQQYRQAAMQWVRAKLRKESGAAISTPEFEGEFHTYFPQYGDGPAVIKQKKLARDQALRGMKAESRGAYDSFFSETPAAEADPPAAETVSPFPEYPNAQRAPDGNWYVEQNGQYFRIDQ